MGDLMPGQSRRLKAAGAWQHRVTGRFGRSSLIGGSEVGKLRVRKTKKSPRETQLARLPLIDPQATTGDIRASFDRMTVKLNIFRMMAHAEANMIPVMRFANSILHKQKLSHVNRELLILQVAHIEGGEYEWRQHVPIALGVGVSQEQIDALDRGDYAAAVFTEPERPLLAFAPDLI